MANHFMSQIKKFFDNVFLSHPREVNENYFHHFYIASRFSGLLLIAGFTCLLHAIFPLFFKSTASTIVIRLAAEMQSRKK